MRLSRHKKRWSDEETDFILEYYGLKSVERIAFHLQRTPLAIQLRAKKIHINMKTNQGFYNVNQLSLLLGIDRNKILNQWIPRGLRFYRLGKVPFKMIRQDWLMAFFRRYPEAYDYVTLNYRTQVYLGMINPLTDHLKLPRPPREKLVQCRHQQKRHIKTGRLLGVDYQGDDFYLQSCDASFWTDLYDTYPRCPRCGSMVSPWAVDYRGQYLQDDAVNFDLNSINISQYYSGVG